MRHTTMGGRQVPVLGLGTWRMGADRARHRDEVEALRLGLDLGMTLIDTAEMYAEGGAEEVTAEAVAGRRDEVYLVTKVLPQNASFEGTLRAAERSLRRLGTDRIDLYLLHWESSHPLEETLRAFQKLRADGKILAHGVSNFDGDLMREAVDLPGGADIASNQILYNLSCRGPERSLIPWCREREIAIMAYSPVEKGQLRPTPGLRAVAERHGVSPYVAAIAWGLREPGVVSIPKASNPDHVRANLAAADLDLTPEDLAQLDRDFPPPDGDAPLETA